MLTIGYTEAHAANGALLAAMERCFPEATHIYVPLETAERQLGKKTVDLLIVTAATLGATAARIGVIKARYPWMAVLFQREAVGDAIETDDGQALPVDGFVTDGGRDHSAALLQAVASAMAHSTAYAFAAASSPCPPSFVASNLVRVVRSIGSIRSARDLATGLGVTLSDLRAESRAVGLLPPKLTLAWLRLVAASSDMINHTQKAERIARHVGYSSATALRNAFREFARTTPSDIRMQGPLRATIEKYRMAVAEWRHDRWMLVGVSPDAERVSEVRTGRRSSLPCAVSLSANARATRSDVFDSK